jgi:hypothetical protein
MDKPLAPSAPAGPVGPVSPLISNSGSTPQLTILAYDKEGETIDATVSVDEIGKRVMFL